MTNLDNFFNNQNLFFIQQVKEWAEIIVNIETKNKYIIKSEHSEQLASICETGSGFLNFLSRMILRSNRPMCIQLFDKLGENLITLRRPFYFFFSDLTISKNNKVFGVVRRRFSIINKKYDLYDENSQIFGTIKSPLWRPWTFKITDTNLTEISIISKKWGGILKEVLTDADQFGIQFISTDLSSEQKAVILGAAISIDMDFFEDNSGRHN